MDIRERVDRITNSRFLHFIIAAITGIILFNVLIGIPQVGIITLDTTILSKKTTDDIINMLKYAGDDSSVKAVVIKIDSPGGEVSKVEEIYLEVLKLRSKKPVVVSVDSNALSGGYYIAAAGNFILVKPSSEIGNVGVISLLPVPWKPDNEQITTGPFKISGRSQKSYTAQVEAVKQAFLMAVILQREDRLRIDKERLSTAEVFLGTEGVRYGLADELGTGSDAVRKAADLAGVANYNILDINDALNITFNGRFHGLADLNKTNTPQNFYLYEELVE